MGNSAECTLLEMVSQQSNEEMHGQLWEAMKAGLIFRTEQSYKFLHDRVQEAAYSLIPQERRAEIHLRVGRLLASHIPPATREVRIFEIVNQLNRGVPLVTSAAERLQIAELNLIAGRRARASTAYKSALVHLAAGEALLSDDHWERYYGLRFALALHRAECEFLTGEPLAADQRLSILQLRAIGSTDLAAVACLRMALYTTDRPDRAVEVGVEQLRAFGIEWSAHPSEEEIRAEYDVLGQRVGKRAIETLVDLPSTSDPNLLALMEVLRAISPSAVFTDRKLHDLAVLRMANLSLEHGHCDGSPLAFAQLSMAIGPRFNHYGDGFRFGHLSVALAEREDLARFRGKVYCVVGYHVLPWTHPIQAASSMMLRALDLAQEAGDLLFAAFCQTHLISLGLASGARLDDLEAEAERYLQSTRRVRFGRVIDSVTTQLALIRMLRGLTPKFGCLDDGDMVEPRMEHHLSSNPLLAIPACWYWIRKLQARYFAGDYMAAMDASSKAQRLLWTSLSHPETVEFCFYGALSHAASWHSAPPDQKQQQFEALKSHHNQLDIWAQNCPENFENRVALVGAEIARIEGRELDAARLYEQAIGSARENSFIHNEALAYELAARFYAARGFKQFADLYLRNARYGYLRWGAVGKVRQLEEMYPELRQEDSLPGPTSTIGAPVEHLDLTTVIKVSQAVSSEIVLENLIDTLMRTAMVQAGAERALLILACGQEPRIEAEATTSGDTVTVRLVDEAVTEPVLPESVLHYVLRTRESVILEDAAAQSPFGVDSYIRQRKARSILCLPLLNQAKLVGVLYFENNLAPRVFSPARISILKLIASQAAIALENARLYRGVAEREEALRKSEVKLRTTQAELAHVGRVMTLDQLTASIAHEVKQPIATARNNARAALNFLDRQPPDLGDVREALGCIVGDADRAGDIIDRIRDHINKAPPRDDSFDLNTAINEVIELAHSAISENGVSVQTGFTDGLYPVQGDRVQVQQVVLNLVLNAVEAMGSVDAGARELLISTEPSQTNGALVIVRDSGPGIDPECIERIFEAFYTTKSGGMGMGLSICRSIIDAHGGRLWAEANEPGGALFQFTIPSAENELTNRPQSTPKIEEPHEDTVVGTSHQPASEDSKRPHPSKHGPGRDHRRRPSRGSSESHTLKR
jgi:signal transduction histidine kinase